MRIYWSTSIQKLETAVSRLRTEHELQKEAEAIEVVYQIRNILNDLAAQIRIMNNEESSR